MSVIAEGNLIHISLGHAQHPQDDDDHNNYADNRENTIATHGYPPAAPELDSAGQLSPKVPGADQIRSWPFI